MDTTQLLLTITLTISTIFLIIIGIQLILVLKELRKGLRHLNKIIDGFESIGAGFEHSFVEIIGFFKGIKTLFKTLDLITHKKNEKSTSNKTEK